MPEEIKITANGRELCFIGTVATYLSWYYGWDAGMGSVAKATKDLPQRALCIDVGANIGIMAITLAVQRPDCHVIAIEPVPENAECLRHNVRANSIENVEVIEAALGERQGTLPMTNSGPWSSVVQGAPLSCRCITLDDFADRDVSFLKIDTEGYEPHVLAGARRLLAKSKPLIHMEFNTLALLSAHYDPISFAKAIWSSFDVLGVYFQENLLPTPTSDFAIVHDNVLSHGSVSDLLLRPKSELPTLDEMIYSPEVVALRQEIETLRKSSLKSTPRRWLNSVFAGLPAPPKAPRSPMSSAAGRAARLARKGLASAIIDAPSAFRDKRVRRAAARNAVSADQARDARDWPTAASGYRRALDIDPQQPAIWVQLGHTLKEQGDFESAEAAYRKSLLLDDSAADTYLQLGHVLKLQGRTGEAANAYFRALARDAYCHFAGQELAALGYGADAISRSGGTRASTLQEAMTNRFLVKA